MCGLVGFTAPGPDAAAVLARMTAAVAHRGPDGEGAFVDRGLALGHRRLAVVDLSGGAQPRVDAERGDALAFNGEIYGFAALAESLRRDGAVLGDHSDTEVLFQLLRRDGIGATLARIDGMFAFAWRDGASGEVHLARDRFGEKPLFYAVRGDSLIFASELAALRRHPLLAEAALDPAAIDAYLALEYVPWDETGFAGVRRLPPGHLLTWRDGAATVAPYWSPAVGAGPAPVASEDEALDRLERLLDESVRERLVADVPVGVFLSGGVDSGLIAAVAARHAAGIAAYTVRMPEASHDETPHAAAVARHCGLRHVIVELSEADLLDAFDAVTAKLDEPMADSSLLPTWLVCRAARRELTVALGGDGADELFAGYPNFQAQRLAAAMAALPDAAGRLLRRGLDLLPASSGYMGLDFRLRQLSHGFGQPPARQSFLWMSPFTPDERRALWTPEARPNADPLAVADRLLAAPGAPAGGMDRLLRLMTQTYLPGHILTKVDRASMYNGLEVRAPFLGRDFAEFAMALPWRWKLKGLTTKHLLKRLAARHLPHEVVWRPKHGFALPLARLLRGPLRQPVREALLDAGNPVAGWFRRPAIERLLDEHDSGRADHRKKIWTLFVLFRVAAKR